MPGGNKYNELRKLLQESEPDESFAMPLVNNKHDVVVVLNKTFIPLANRKIWEVKNNLKDIQASLTTLANEMHNANKTIEGIQSTGATQDSMKSALNEIGRQGVAILKEALKIEQSRKKAVQDLEKISTYLKNAGELIDHLRKEIEAENSRRQAEDMKKLFQPEVPKKIQTPPKQPSVEMMPLAERNKFIDDFSRILNEQATKYWRDPINEFKIREIETQRNWLLRQVEERKISLDEARDMFNKALTYAQERNSRVGQLIQHLNQQRLLL